MFLSCFHLQTYEILSEAKKSDSKKRERLLELFIKTDKFMDELDTDFTETLQKSLGDFKTTLKKNIDDIKPRDQYVVLVAGKMTQLLLCIVFSRIHSISISRLIVRIFQEKSRGSNIILCFENL